jgi:hypothetical protein
MAAGEYAIGADYMIEVSGLCCDIASVTVRSYDDDGWVLLTSQAEAAKDESRMEVGVASSVIGGASQIDFIIETTDWCGERDTAPNEEYDLVMRTWAVDSSGPTATATQSSNQRKVFQDGANFWSFYVDGSDTIYAHSSDGGLTWTPSPSRAFNTTGITGVSVWYDPADDTVYAVGDVNSNTNNVRVKSGTVGSSSISWGTEYTVSVSSNGMSNKNTFICKDADGFLWIMATVKTGSGSTYDLAVYQSDDPDQIDAWTQSSLMLTTDSSTSTAKGSVLPTGTGSDVWAVYNYDLKVAARKCTGGSWGSEETIFAGSGTGLDYINTAPASALVDEDGVVHVVYGDDTKNGVAKPSIQYDYRDASGWAGAIALDDTLGSAANKHPSISLDTSSECVYAVWVQDDTENIKCKKNTSGTWSFLTISGQTSYEKNHLTSVYSVSGESNICWIWTQNKTGTMEVFFHKIPEFQDIALPVFTIMVMFIVLSGRKNARRKKDGAAQQVDPIDEAGF